MLLKKNKRRQSLCQRAAQFVTEYKIDRNVKECLISAPPDLPLRLDVMVRIRSLGIALQVCIRHLLFNQQWHDSLLTSDFKLQLQLQLHFIILYCIHCFVMYSFMFTYYFHEYPVKRAGLPPPFLLYRNMGLQKIGNTQTMNCRK